MVRRIESKEFFIVDSKKGNRWGDFYSCQFYTGIKRRRRGEFNLHDCRVYINLSNVMVIFIKVGITLIKNHSGEGLYGVSRC